MSSSKRPLNSASSAKSKRRKNEGQSRLDSFFGHASPSKVKPDSPKKRVPKDPEIIDVDSLDNELSTNQSSASLSQTASLQLHPITFIQTQHEPGETSAPQYTSLAVDPISFDPQTAYVPHSNGILYSFLAHALSTVSGTRSRIAILDTLTNYFRTVIVHHPQSLLPSLYLLSNTLSPPYSVLELNIGPSIISHAIQQVSGLSSASLKKLYSSSGDPGDVAFIAKSNTRTLLPHPPLLVTSVYKSLLKIATCKGQGATKEKQKIIEKLLVSAKGEEIRFLVRTLSQNLRVGAVRTSLLTALARGFVLTPLTPAHKESSLYASPDLLSSIQPIATGSRKKKPTTEIARDELLAKFRLAEHLLRKVFVQHPDYDHIVDALLEGGLDDLPERVPLTVGIPVYPALGSPIRSFDEVFERLNDMPFAAELKYDGQRAQIHASRQSDGRIYTGVFSRHLEDMTSKYPDVAALMQALFKQHQDTQSLIIDSEVVAIDCATGSLKSFQALSGRARKDVSLQEVEIPVAVFAFDLIYLDGNVLLERPFRARRNLLRTRFPAFIPENKLVARFQHVESCDSEEGQVPLQNFWESVVSRHQEGLMLKLLDDEVRDSENAERKRKLLSAVYDADKRTFSWMKLKKDYVSGLGDSLDLIPIGAWYGNGRKVNWWSPVLLGIWDPSRGYPVAVCKCMSGFTDAFYKTLSERYSLDDATNCSKSRLWHCEVGGFKPDVYFKPQEVWEIRGADVTLSPVSIAAQHLTSSSKGLSLRFPRFVRLRDDKSITQASDASFLANMWRSQQGKSKEDDGDELIDISNDSGGDYAEMDNESE
ncbi:ATP-dependent DNA ligase [Gymnopus androsaceus JB14]|uniref:DNA ligase n=1 Tax=Gymnopus androsaceus JB14 TaxID=1447944 RepID=A0A6A4IT53_9AGAR|nr:ATP-dependent DNA ligase [Gymnopus androsaceus JB14]